MQAISHVKTCINISLCEDSESHQPNSAESGPAQLSYPHIQRTLEPSLQGSVDQFPPTLDTTSILHHTTKRYNAFTTAFLQQLVKYNCMFCKA